MAGKNIPVNERIIFALDVSSAEEAKKWVERLESHIRFYKVGLQLFLADWFGQRGGKGESIIGWIAGRGHKVMADLKLFDVPETVKLAVRQVRGSGVSFLTVHGNDPIMKAAAAEKGDIKILAVTLLTSFGEQDAGEFFGGAVRAEDLVAARAARAIEAGCDGVVCSGLEAKRLRDDLGENFIMVTPGIRPGKDAGRRDDQRRVSTAGRAVAEGADYVVVGRPIRDAQNPIEVVQEMQKEIEDAS